MTKWKRNNYKFWHSPFALIVFFFFLLFFGYRIIDLIQTNKETIHKKELILDQIDDLKEKEVLLSDNLLRLETEEGKEEIIREKYQVTKQGEKMVIIVDDKNIESSKLEEKNSHGFWNWIKRIFNK